MSGFEGILVFRGSSQDGLHSYFISNLRAKLQHKNVCILDSCTHMHVFCVHRLCLEKMEDTVNLVHSSIAC